MWSVQVVVDPPCFDDVPGFGKVADEVFDQTFVAEPTVKPSTKVFCIGLLGAM